MSSVEKDGGSKQTKKLELRGRMREKIQLIWNKRVIWNKKEQSVLIASLPRRGHAPDPSDLHHLRLSPFINIPLTLPSSPALHYGPTVRNHNSRGGPVDDGASTLPLRR